jgi:hypothetical protein
MITSFFQSRKRHESIPRGYWNKCMIRIADALRLLLLLAVPLLTCCSHPEPAKGISFQVKVNLSEAARKRLVFYGETITIHAHYDGDRKLLSFGGFEKTAPFRDVVLGSQRIEIRPGEVAKFDPAIFSGEDVSALSGGVYYVTLNVVSSRTAFPNNLLSCDVLEGVSARFSDKVVEVDCT